ncbi:cupin domain-containing protein [Sphingomonas sp. YL-JM2C]
MNEPAANYSFVPAQAGHAVPDRWQPIKVPRAEIAAEIDRLAERAVEPGARRSSEIVHANALDLGRGITPGLSIAIQVLRPGETIMIDRDNANRVEFCLGGEGEALLGQRSFRLEKWSAWMVPSMTPRLYRNSGRELLIWLSYSNQPLLERAGVYYADAVHDHPQAAPRRPGINQYARDTAPDIAISDDGARLRGYEFLTDIEVVDNPPLLWPWREMLPHLSRRQGDDKRTIMLMYNPATGRRNGTTHSFFATITSFPAGPLRPPPPRGHRHSSFATNYHFEGAGESVVDGQRFEWEAGDLMFSAPSWAEHSHGISERGASVLTVQDHPFQIGMGALIWQEDMAGPVLTLGSEPGQTGYVGPRLAGE